MSISYRAAGAPLSALLIASIAAIAPACGSPPTSESTETTAHSSAALVSNLPGTPAPADFDGDGKADISLRAPDGYWLIDYAKNGFGGDWDEAHGGYGGTESYTVPADYDGDGKADLSDKDNAGHWYIDLASDGFSVWNATFSGYGDNSGIPAPADYDGDGRADLAIKGSDGNFYLDYSNSGANVQPPPALGAFGAWDAIYANKGVTGFTPVPADYDGDGRADIVVVGPDGTWWFDFSNTPAAPAKPSPGSFGAWDAAGRPAHWAAGGSGYVPMQGDFDGDGRANMAFRDPSGVVWIFGSPGSFAVPIASYAGYGSTTIPAIADYDGDHRADLSESDSSTWYINYAADGLGAWNQIIPFPEARSWSLPEMTVRFCSIRGIGLPTTRALGYQSGDATTTAFEDNLAALGCTYQPGGAPNAALFAKMAWLTTTLGFSVTICPDTPSLHALLATSVGATTSSGALADSALGGGPYLARTPPRQCMRSLGANQLYVLWDPICPGGCPLPLSDGI